MKTANGPGVGVTVGVIVGVGEFVEVGVAVGVAVIVQVGDGDLVAVGLGMEVRDGWSVGTFTGWLGIGCTLHAASRTSASIGPINCWKQGKPDIIFDTWESRGIPEDKFYAFVTVKNV